jgi:hypothetical protein
MFSKEKNFMEATMNAVNTVSEIHHLGEYVTGQNEGRKDQAITGNDLYNFAVQTDANFMTVRGDIRNIGTVMNSEFKGVYNEFKGVYNEFKGVYNEFKIIRMEMASGFAAVDARFNGVEAQFNSVDNEFKVVRMEMASGFAGVEARFKVIDNEFKVVRMEMASEFKLVRMEMAIGFAAVDAEFKAVRAEMKEGFARLRIEIQRSNWRVSASTIGALIALFGIDRFWL